MEGAIVARLFNVVVGTWLIVSTFAWPHDHAMHKVAIACGLLTIILSVASIFVERAARYITLAVAALLVVLSVLHVGRHDPVFWNNAIVAFAISLTTVLGVRHEPALAA